MKLRLTNATFDASAKQITHPSFSDIGLSGIQFIVNVTHKVVIYGFLETSKGGSLAGDTLTLDYDTSLAMADTDDIMIYVEDGVSASSAYANDGTVYPVGNRLLVAGKRQDASGPPAGVADGDVHPFIFNEEGRLKTSTQPAIYTATTGTITANGQTVSVDVSRASNLMFHVTGTFSTVNCAFEGSINGGATWFGVQAIRTNANTIETSTGNLSATPVYAWEASVNALTNFRVRATAYTSGTQTWRFQPGAYATEPIPGIQTHAVTGSGTFISGGVAAIDAAISGSPVLQGARASSARPTAMSADNDVQALWVDRHGAQIMENAGPRGLKDQQVTTITSSTAETTIVTAVAAVFMDLHGLIITNTSATACVVTIKDATAGTTRMTIAIPAGETRGFMLPSTDAHKQAVVNNNWTATCSASVASINITAFTVRRV